MVRLSFVCISSRSVLFLVSLDVDLLQMQRQHPNMGFRDHNTMSNSVDDLTQLTDHISYPNSSFGQDFSDPDDGITDILISIVKIFLLYSNR